MGPWTLRVAELNIQYYEGLLAEGLHPTKAVIVRQLLAAERETLARLREERRSGAIEQSLPRSARAPD